MPGSLFSRAQHLGPLLRSMREDRAHLLSRVVDFVVGAEVAAPITGTLPVPKPGVPTGRVRAGVGKSDLTPPPGWPTAGHSIEARIARGVWTRLHARAVYLEDAQGEGLVLCVCDLWAITASLVDEVTARVMAHEKGAQLSRAQLLISATHTHHAQGNYASNRVYNDHTTSRPGHDPAMRAFLVEQIATAIIDALESAEPARLRLAQDRVQGIARNRAPNSFLRNHDAREFIDAHPRVPDPKVRYGRADSSFRTIDDRLRVLRMERDDGSLIGVAAFFTAHNTAVPNHAPLNHADFYGVATRVCEARLTSDDEAPVVALFNGPQGDVSPNWEYQSLAAALTLGHQLGHALGALIEGAATDGRDITDGVVEGGGVSARMERTSLFGQRFVDERGVERRTARFPMAGASQFGGAEDGRTVLYVLGWKPGIRARVPDEDQGAKKPALFHPLINRGMRLTRALLPHDHVPETIPVQVARFGPLVFGALPGEFTTMMGHRVAGRVAARAEVGRDEVFLLGLAGEYLSYFTTPEEYEAQDYEAASMMFGPQAGSYLATRFEGLAMPAGAPLEKSEVRFIHHPGPLGSFPKAMATLDDERAVAAAFAAVDPTAHVEGWPSFEYTAPAATLDALPRSPLPAAARVVLEARGASGDFEPLVVEGMRVDDEGVHLVSILLERGAERDRWRVYYVGPVPEGVQLRFRVETADGKTELSGVLDARRAA